MMKLIIGCAGIKGWKDGKEIKKATVSNWSIARARAMWVWCFLSKCWILTSCVVQCSDNSDVLWQMINFTSMKFMLNGYLLSKTIPKWNLLSVRVSFSMSGSVFFGGHLIPQCFVLFLFGTCGQEVCLLSFSQAVAEDAPVFNFSTTKPPLM